MENGERFRVLASGVQELWADGVRTGHRLDALGEAALEAERPLHVAVAESDHTVCGRSAASMREYPVEFSALEERLRCPRCDDALGHPTT